MINPKNLALTFLAMTFLSGVEASNTKQSKAIKRGRRQSTEQSSKSNSRIRNRSRSNQYWEKDVNCRQWKNRQCVKCAERTFRKDGKCITVNPLCNTYANDGCCTTCYPGFILSGTTCVVAPPTPPPPTPSTPNTPITPPIDPLCSKFNGGKCEKCSQRAYFGQNGTCVQANPLCKSFNKAACTQCYQGFTLVENDCKPSKPKESIPEPVKPIVPTQPVDPLCRQWKNGKCVECSSRAYFSNGECVQSNPLCATFSKTDGCCLSCYSGFQLRGGACLVKQVKAKSKSPQLRKRSVSVRKSVSVKKVKISRKVSEESTNWGSDSNNKYWNKKKWTKKSRKYSNDSY